MKLDLNAIIQLVSLAVTAGTNIVLAIKHNSNGTVDISVTTTQAQADLAADLQQAAAWYAAHPQTPAGGTQ
jgi:hypothetical protein